VSPCGGLALGRSLVSVGLRGCIPVPVLVIVKVWAGACAVRPRRGMIPVLARPLPLTLPAGSRPPTAGRPGSVLVMIAVSAAPRVVCRRGLTAVLARLLPLTLAARSWPLAASFAAHRLPAGRIPARRLSASPFLVTPGTCGLIPGGFAAAPWAPGWLAIARCAPAPVTFCPTPVPPGRLTRGGGTRRRVAGRGPGGGGGPPGTAAARRARRRVLAAAAVGYGGTLGRYRAWPPGGVRTRTRCRLPGLFGEIAVLLAIVVPAAMARSRPVIGCLPRTGGPPRAGRTGRCGPEPVLPDPRRSGRGAVSGCPGGPSVPRCCSTEKLSAPEQNSGAESERREDAHGDRSVDQSQAGREHPGHEHRHRRNGQKGTGADHVRPPATRRGAPGCWLPAVVRRTVRGVEAPVVPSGLG